MHVLMTLWQAVREGGPLRGVMKEVEDKYHREFIIYVIDDILRIFGKLYKIQAILNTLSQLEISLGQTEVSDKMHRV